jgi:hypothetical protein
MDIESRVFKGHSKSSCTWNHNMVHNVKAMLCFPLVVLDAQKSRLALPLLLFQ